MSPAEKIAKLESLLARVRERADAPRRSGAAVFPSPAAEPAAPAMAEPSTLAPGAPAGEIPAAALRSVRPIELSSGWSEPPEVFEAAPETLADPLDRGDDNDDVVVEVSAEIVEVDLDLDEPGLMPAESGAQLVAAAPAAPAAPAEPEPEPDAVVPANEVVEPAPSSSPRPIASEHPDPYEEESAPRHTSPPESGKQVASPSVVPEPAGRVSSVPPSAEGHTLIGGWRDPGVPRGLSDARSPGVRVPPPPPPPPPDVFATAGASPSRGAGEPSSFGPITTRPELPESAEIAIIEGAAPQLAPATFGELLDATLAL